MVGVQISYLLIIYLIIKDDIGTFVLAGKEDQVTFYHFPNQSSHIKVNLDNLHSLNLKKHVPLFIIIDGFLSNLEASMSQSVKDSMLQSRPNNCNVIVVDWSALSGFDSLKLDGSINLSHLMMVYTNAMSKVDFVGDKVAKLLEQLVLHSLTDYSKVHVIGFSLGSHIAGVAGMHVIELYNRHITRITGLDPAGVGFSMKDPRKRLDKSDAEFVDVYYTNRFAAGDMEHHVGHVDVYINGGKVQPGCTSPSLIDSTICNHAFSWKSWNKCMTEKCEACPCSSSECQTRSGNCANKSKVIVGMGVSMDIEGDYYLEMGPLLP